MDSGQPRSAPLALRNTLIAQQILLRVFLSTSNSPIVDTDFFQAQTEAREALHRRLRAAQEARTFVPYQSRGKSAPKFRKVPRVVTEGGRTANALAWSEEDAFVSNVRAPGSPPDRDPDHCCPLCASLFSHPVINRACGHAYCYLCIRGHFQNSFRCPIAACNVLTVISEPVRAPALDKALAGLYAVHYPNWVDTSEATYTFDGLIFPRREPISASEPISALFE
ncbi:hypothetical protein C8F01DRAFT_1265496 [Mycena amicta]|nr:hypothetical protein C8F01DRAFT_1265496 [Mycena amicta]